MTADFTPKLAPVDEPRLGKAASLATLLVKSILAKRHKYFLAAAIQLGITTLFPGRFATVPIATLALAVLTTHLLDKLTPSGPLPPAHMLDVVPGRATALIPRRDGSFGAEPSNHPLVVFNLGAQFNHPRGQLSPYAKDLGERFRLLNRELLSRRDELGLLSVTNWNGSDSQEASGAGPDTMLISYYFRDLESLHRFAHEEMHREAWDWYHTVRPSHLGIFHETFVVPAHAHETIYLNCRPFLLGAGLVKVHDGDDDSDGDDDDTKRVPTWRNVLVSADHVALKTQWQRLKRNADGEPRE